MGAMRSGTASRAQRILLLCVLTLSVLGMHHVALPSSEPGHSVMTTEASTAMAGTQPSGDAGSGMGHDLLHLCLVVLSAAAGFVLATWLLATVGASRAEFGDRPSFPRPPRAAGRSLLASVCVLRL